MIQPNPIGLAVVLPITIYLAGGGSAVTEFLSAIHPVNAIALLTMAVLSLAWLLDSATKS